LQAKRGHYKGNAGKSAASSDRVIEKGSTKVGMEIGREGVKTGPSVARNASRGE